MVKTLEPHIKKAFIDLGFTDEEIKSGCWLLEKAFKKGEEKKPIAWIALHKFLERVADKAGIVFDKPSIMNCQEKEVAILVNGTKGDKNAWSIGEASIKNCTNDYRWAMAEKRAKDRVVLKLLGVAGEMYSEEEADEFKRLNEQQETELEVRKLKNEIKAEKAKETRELNKKIDEYNKTPEGIKLRFNSAIACINGMHQLDIAGRDKKLFERCEVLLQELDEAKMEEEHQKLKDLINKKIPEVESDDIPDFN